MTSAALGSSAQAAAVYVFDGATSQSERVHLEVARSLKKISLFAIEVDLNCDSAGALKTVALTAVNLPVHFLDGKAKFSVTGQYNTSTTFNGSPATLVISPTIAGKISISGRASGRYSAGVTVLDPAGTKIDHCSTGPQDIAWAALVH